MKPTLLKIAAIAAVATLGPGTAAHATCIRSGQRSTPASGTGTWWATSSGSQSSDTPEYTAAGGNPGGAIFADDGDSGGGEAISAFINIGDSYTGDLSKYYGGKIKFDLLESDNASKPARISFGNKKFSFFAKARPAPGIGWQRYKVPLKEKAWRVVANGPPPIKRAAHHPTKKAFKKGLAHVHVVAVFADYLSTLPEEVSMDNYGWFPPND